MVLHFYAVLKRMDFTENDDSNLYKLFDQSLDQRYASGLRSTVQCSTQIQFWTNPSFRYLGHWKSNCAIKNSQLHSFWVIGRIHWVWLFIFLGDHIHMHGEEFPSLQFRPSRNPNFLKAKSRLRVGFVDNIAISTLYNIFILYKHFPYPNLMAHASRKYSIQKNPSAGFFFLFL